MSSTCDNCGEAGVKYATGWHYDHEIKTSTMFYGNLLCACCLKEVEQHVWEYRPAPGYSQPARIIVARQKAVTITNKQAITFAIASGNWLKAAEIRKCALDGKRFYVKDLYCKKWYMPLHTQTKLSQAPPPQAQPLQAPPSHAPPPQASQPQAPQPQGPHPQAPPAQAPPPQAPPQVRSSTQNCSICNRMYAINADGTMRAHSFLGRRCIG